MSSQLYRLGRAVARHRRPVLLGWLAALVLAGLAAFASGGALEDDLTIPGTEGQRGIDVLAQRFPQLAGTSGQVLFVADEGSRVADLRDEVADVVERLEEVDDVVAVTDPFAEGNEQALADDGRHAIATVQLGVSVDELADSTVEALEDALASIPDDVALEAHLGGSVYTETSVHISVVEALGVVVALAVLVLMFGSLLAAGMPLLTALLGIGVAMALTLGIAALTPISTTAPTLALMIGLAVGIDYALFVLSRHRSQLASGTDVTESIARSVATAGSAVVFAGATVVIALSGLFVVGIPFLTVMGLVAALAVTIAVAVALTALPALLAVAGERLRPRPGSRAERRALAELEAEVEVDDDAASSPRRQGLAARWVGGVTRRPVLTLVVVLAALLTAAVPAKDLALALPDNGTADAGSPQRVTHDLVADAYGEGWNAPMIVMVDIVRSTDPLGVMERLADDLRELDGVAAIGIATPNETADLGIVQIVPEAGQADAATTALVHEIRDLRTELEERHDVDDLVVTGQTAVAIDVSERLSDALVPFGAFVVGLSLLLLTVVFRSIWVPVKATVGYLFSVLAAFGAVAAVFQWGWLADALNVSRTGPVISFMPIILMGVLFGLAMDYEVFLVSRMREAYVHGADARTAVVRGFRASAAVVAAAAVIMVSVFAAFVPTSAQMVKPIALGLAVGVAVDAFVVRMTLVPAALVLLGDRAWRLPRWLDRRMPTLDVEGAALEHHLAHEAWEAEHGAVAVRAEAVRFARADGAPVAPPVDAVVRSGQVLAVAAEDAVARRALLHAVAGRLEPADGTLVVLDRVLPDEAGWVRAHVLLVADWSADRTLAGTVDDLLAGAGRRRPAPRLVVVDGVDRPGTDPAARWAEVASLATDGTTVVAGAAAPVPDGVVPPHLLVRPTTPVPQEVAP